MGEGEGGGEGQRAAQGSLEAGRPRREGRRRDEGRSAAQRPDQRTGGVVRRAVGGDRPRHAGAHRHGQVRRWPEAGARRVRAPRLRRLRAPRRRRQRREARRAFTRRDPQSARRAEIAAVTKAVLLSAAVLALPGCAARSRPAAAPLAPSAAERTLGSDLAHVFGAAVTERAAWGVEVRSLDTGRVLYALNADKLMMPASNMKILTLATAAEVLGWDYRFATTLETAAPVDAGVLAGDLVVRGGGDPTINGRSGRGAALFDEWADALKRAGIFRVAGRLVGDDNAFDDGWLGAGWAWDYLQYGYAAPAGALELDESVARLTVTPGVAAGDAPFVDLTPGAGLTLLNHASTGPAGSAMTVDYQRRLDEPTLEIFGSIASDAAPAARDVAVVNPTRYFVQGVKDALAARGVAIDGAAVDADDVLDAPAPDARRVLVRSLSPPLQEIA